MVPERVAPATCARVGIEKRIVTIKTADSARLTEYAAKFFRQNTGSPPAFVAEQMYACMGLNPTLISVQVDF